MKSHKFDPWSFIGGLTLLLFGLVVLIPDSSSMVTLRLDSILGYFLPAVALAIGAALANPSAPSGPHERRGATRGANSDRGSGDGGTEPDHAPHGLSRCRKQGGNIRRRRRVEMSKEVGRYGNND